MDIVGCIHDEPVEVIEKRIPDKEYDILLHEDFNHEDELSWSDYWMKILCIPVFAFSFYMLKPMRFLSRTLSNGGKSDYKVRQRFKGESSSIDSPPSRTVALHQMTGIELFLNWASIISFLSLTGLSIWHLYRMDIFSNLLSASFQVLYIIMAATILGAVLLLSWEWSREERDEYMVQRVLEYDNQDKEILVLVGDDHVPGIYHRLATEHNVVPSTYRPA